MKKIRSLINQFYATDKELVALEKKEDAARAEMIKHSSHPDTAAARRAITEAAATYDLCDVARGKIAQVGHTDFLAEITRLVNAWESAVQSAHQAEQERIIQANLPAWDGDEQGCRRFWEYGNMIQMPALHKYRTAFFNGPILTRLSLPSLVSIAETFQRHVERHAEAAGIDLESIFA